MSNYVVCFVTASSSEEAKKIAVALVEEKHAACVNIVPGVESVYQWEGKIETGAELLLIIKTQKTKIPALIKRVKTLHSYSVPEVISLPILSGNRDYLNWIRASVK